MRTALFSALLIASGCGGGPPAPQPMTSLVVTVLYEAKLINAFSVNGATSVTARRFGPYDVAAPALPSGATLGFVFDASDAGPVMVCVSGRETDGTLRASGCGMFGVRAGEVVRDTLTLMNGE